MSKRTGEMVTFEELIDEVGVDATRYLMLSRSADQPIDFDIEVAKKKDASNPVYYVQYAHARICSILRKAADEADVAAVEAGQLTSWPRRWPPRAATSRRSPIPPSWPSCARWLTSATSSPWRPAIALPSA